MVPNQPSIEIWGLRLDEPVTGATDLLVTALCWYAFYKLHKRPAKTSIHKWLKWYFFTMGLATAFGGIIGHSLQYALSTEWKMPGWFISMLSVMLIERASIEYSGSLISERNVKILRWINIAELAAFVIISYTLLDFFYVLVHSAYGLGVVVGGLNWYIYGKTKSRGSRLMMTSVGVATIGAIFFVNKWYLSKWFNHMDIGHTFMAASSYVFYKAALAIIDETESRQTESRQTESRELESSQES